MKRPEVARVALDGLPPPAFRLVVGAAFLERIGVHALHATILRNLVVPCAEHARDHRPHHRAAPGVERHGVVKLERQQVERRIRQHLFPAQARPHDVAGRPCLQRLDVELLAPGRGREVGLDLVERLLDPRQQRLVLQHQEEIAADALRQHAGRILLQRRLDMAARRGPVIHVGRDGLIDVLRRLRAGRGDRKAPAINLHVRPLQPEPLTPRSAARPGPSAPAPASPGTRGCRRPAGSAHPPPRRPPRPARR